PALAARAQLAGNIPRQITRNLASRNRPRTARSRKRRPAARKQPPRTHSFRIGACARRMQFLVPLRAQRKITFVLTGSRVASRRSSRRRCQRRRTCLSRTAPSRTPAMKRSANLAQPKPIVHQLANRLIRIFGLGKISRHHLFIPCHFHTPRLLKLNRRPAVPVRRSLSTMARTVRAFTLTIPENEPQEAIPGQKGCSCPAADSYILRSRPTRRDGRVAEGGGLLNRIGSKALSGVRIPLSPPSCPAILWNPRSSLKFKHLEPLFSTES